MTLRHGNDLRFDADRYRLALPYDRPFLYLEDAAGRMVAELFIASSVNTTDGQDDTVGLSDWQVQEHADETIFSRDLQSSIWSRKSCVLRCSPGRFRYEIYVAGTGSITEATYFGGFCSALPRWGSGWFSSGHRFLEGFNPEPDAERPACFSPETSTGVDLSGGPLPGKRHWFFTPAPFCLAFRTDSGWLGLGVESSPGHNLFSEYRYHGGSAFHLSLDYAGAISVDGDMVMPAIGLDFGSEPQDCLAKHVAALTSAGLVRGGDHDEAPWWRQPIFCGWGAQCHLAAMDHPADAPDAHSQRRAVLAALRFAPEYARQDIYERFVAELAERALRPGTIVVDDKWQESYGTNVADRRKWPDLRGFIDRRHADGQRVLLWLKAWDREGVPDDECIVNTADVPLTVDPTNPRYRRRLRESIHHLLSERDYNADGFKIDFTHRIPVGPGLRAFGRERGLELLKLYLSTIHDEAKQVKHDALLVTHTPHPYLAGALDMIRLNDMMDLSLPPDGRHEVLCREMSLRAQVARISCPEALIDTDNWPVPDRSTWRRYVQEQPCIGVPSLYFTTHIDSTGEPLEDEDYTLIKEVWKCSRPT